MENHLKLISADTMKCVSCRACAEVCPMGVIEISTDGFPEPKSCAYRLCINCGYCVDACNFDALYHRVRKRLLNSGKQVKRCGALRTNDVSLNPHETGQSHKKS